MEISTVRSEGLEDGRVKALLTVRMDDLLVVSYKEECVKIRAALLLKFSQTVLGNEHSTADVLESDTRTTVR